MKFLASLINNSMQPARRIGIPQAVHRAESFSPPHPLQGDLPGREKEQLLQAAPDPVAQLTPAKRSDRLASRSTNIAEGGPQAELQADETPLSPADPPRTDPVEPARPAAPVGQAEENDSSAAETVEFQRRRGGASIEMQSTREIALEPSVPQGGGGDTPAVFVEQGRAAVRPNQPQPAAARIPGVEAKPARPSTDPLPADVGDKSAADSASAEIGRDDRASANQLLINESDGEGSTTKLQGQRQAEIPVRRMPEFVSQEPSLPLTPPPHKAGQQQPTRETPQVRIGQINVLVEDQAPARPKQGKRSAKPAVSNPFGLRGL